MRKLSVLIPAYKASEWVSESISSVLAQSLPDEWELEVFVGVDGWRDDGEKTYWAASRVLSLRVAKGLGSADWALFTFSKNVGTYLAINALLKKCHGEAITVFGADDVMFPGRLSKMIAALDGGADYVQTAAVELVDGKLSEDVIPAESLSGVAMYAREVYERLGGYQPWMVAADTEFHARAAACGFVCREIDEPLFAYRQHPEQMTRREETSRTSRVRHGHAISIQMDVQAYEAGVEVPKIKPKSGRARHRFGAAGRSEKVSP